MNIMQTRTWNPKYEGFNGVGPKYDSFLNPNKPFLGACFGNEECQKYRDERDKTKLEEDKAEVDKIETENKYKQAISKYLQNADGSINPIVIIAPVLVIAVAIVMIVWLRK